MQTRNQFLSGLVPLGHLPEGVENECAICFEEFDAPVALPCSDKHVFCSACITKWVCRRRKNTCPVCRYVHFAIHDSDRGPIGADRLQILAHAMQHSRLITDEFDTYSQHIRYTVPDVRRAAAAPHSYLAEERHSPISGGMLIDMDHIGPHIIPQANLLRSYARASGRAYSDAQEAQWKIIVGRLHDMTYDHVLNGRNLARMAREYRRLLRESLIQHKVDVSSGGFFEADADVESPTGDLDVLLSYVLYQANQAGRRWEVSLAAQAEALQQETSVFGYALRLAGQSLFGGFRRSQAARQAMAERWT